MFKILALAAAVTASPVLSTPPVAATYDPCVRATRDYHRALVEYENAQQCRRGPPRVCDVPDYEAAQLRQARQRMRDACRN